MRSAFLSSRWQSSRPIAFTQLFFHDLAVRVSALDGDRYHLRHCASGGTDVNAHQCTELTDLRAR